MNVSSFPKWFSFNGRVWSFGGARAPFIDPPYVIWGFSSSHQGVGGRKEHD